jgi:hypothetical protein
MGFGKRIREAEPPDKTPAKTSSMQPRKARKQSAPAKTDQDNQVWNANHGGWVPSTLPETLRNLMPVDRSWYDELPLPVEYIVDPIWQVDEACLFNGQASVGKSYFLLPMHVAIGTGTNFFKFKVPKARKSLYVMCERAEDKLRRRWYKITQAWAKNQPKNQRETLLDLLHANCYLKAIAGDTLGLIEFVDNQWRPSAVVDELIAELKAAGIEVVFFDPLSRLHGGNENDSAVGAAITKAFERIIRQTGCSVMVAHHTGKNDREDMHAGRGTSALNDNCSETFHLGLVSDEQRKLLDLSMLTPEEQHYDLLKWQHSRCSDGAKQPPMFIVRDGLTGLLRHINAPQSASELVQEQLSSKKFKKWIKKHSPLTNHEFYSQRRNALPDGETISERDAEQLLKDATTAGLFRATGETRNRGDLFEWIGELGSLAVVGRPTAQLGAQLKNRAERKHV